MDRFDSGSLADSQPLLDEPSSVGTGIPRLLQAVAAAQHDPAQQPLLVPPPAPLLTPSAPVPVPLPAARSYGTALSPPQPRRTLQHHAGIHRPRPHTPTRTLLQALVPHRGHSHSFSHGQVHGYINPYAAHIQRLNHNRSPGSAFGHMVSDAQRLPLRPAAASSELQPLASPGRFLPSPLMGGSDDEHTSLLIHDYNNQNMNSNSNHSQRMRVPRPGHARHANSNAVNRLSINGGDGGYHVDSGTDEETDVEEEDNNNNLNSSDGFNSSNKAGLYSFYAFVVLGFFWVSGGCYGNEELFAAAPPVVVFPCLLITPLIFSLPLALTTVELSAAMPFDGGLVSWVHVVLGPRLGGHNSYWNFVGYAIDSTIYPLLAGQYIATTLPRENALHKAVGETQVAPLIGSIFIVLVAGIKLMGTDVLVKFNSVLILASLLPVLIFIAWTMPYWNIDAWTQGGGDHPSVDFSLLFAWQIWLYSGFASLGCLASEVEKPQRTMPKALLVLLPVAVLVNILPLMSSLSLDPDYKKYHVGRFESVATSQLGGWLGIWMTIGVQLVMLGLFNGGSMVADRSLAQLVTSRFKCTTLTGVEEAESTSKVWRWMVDDTVHGVGPMFEIITTLLNLILVWLPYALLVEIGVLCIAVSTFLQVVVFIMLRIKRPRMHRPFKVPGGMIGAVICCLFPLTMTTGYAVIAFTDVKPTVIQGQKLYYVKAIGFIAIFVMGLIGHALYRWCRGRRAADEEELSPGSLDDFPDDEEEAGKTSAKAKGEV